MDIRQPPMMTIAVEKPSLFGESGLVYVRIKPEIEARIERIEAKLDELLAMMRASDTPQESI